MTLASRRALCGLILVFLVPTAPASADRWQVDLDTEETRIEFELGATLHTVRGTARLREGRLVFDPESGGASGQIVVAAPSLTTNNERRDRAMHQKVLQSDAFPEIRLAPRVVRGELGLSGESRLTIEGVFSLHGEDHEVTMDALARTEAGDLTVDLEFEVPYVSWGLKDPSRALLRVAKVVRVRVLAKGSLVAESESIEEPG